MKKKYIIFSLVTLVLLVALITSFNYFKTTNTYIDDSVNNQTKITKGISMNLEQTAGAGDYKTVTRSSWPTEGYKFNTELSRCENGGELSWDDINKKVIVTGNVSDKCYVYFDIWIPSIAAYCTSGTDLATCVKNFGDQGPSVSNIYIHNSALTNGAGDNSYRFAGGDYQLTLKATSAGLKTVITSVKTASDGVINFYCNGTKQYVGFTCTSTYTRYYSLQYDTSNTQYQSYKEALAKAVADGYLTQNNIKNFVCFGTNESPCPTENLYRIIGVIDNKIKLIKYDYATSAILGTNGGYNNNTQVFYYSGDKESQDNIEWYTWNKTTKTNSWSDAELNTINLNTNYLNNLGSDWSNKIVTTTWQVGGNTLAKIGRTTMNLVYQNEVKTPATSTTYDAKIGLMYISDYGYAANPKYWTYQEYNSSDATKDYSAAAEANWMYGGFYDWIITRLSDYTNVVMRTLASGNVGSTTTYDATASVRMVFNLDENVIYKSGLGTQDNPIILN